MGYAHLTLIERGKLEAFLELKLSTRAIAAKLGRHHSTIARKIKRNRLEYLSYKAIQANSSSSYRRTNASQRCKITPELINIIEKRLAETWSPAQIVNADLRGQLSFKSIYRFLYDGKIADGNLLFLRHKGRRKKAKETRGQFANGMSISERPPEVEDRQEFGHWELDSMVSSRGASKGCFCTLVERTSRFIYAFVMPDRTAKSMESAITQLFNLVPREAFKTATSDRGKEFACHQRIKEQLGIQIYFADPYSSWQRGSNENANGLLREFFPKKTDLANVTQAELDEKLKLINRRPRMVLGWKSAEDVFLQEVSRFS